MKREIFILVFYILFAVTVIAASVDYYYRIDSITGVHNVEFKLYTSQKSEYHIWSETHEDVEFNSGNFSVELGSLNPMVTLDSETDYYIEIIIDGEVIRRSVFEHGSSTAFARELDATDSDSGVILEEMATSLEIGNQVDAVTVLRGTDFGIGLDSGVDPLSTLDVREGSGRFWDGSASISYATMEGELYVENDLEVDNTIYAGHYRGNAGGDLLHGGSDISVSEEVDGSWTIDFSGTTDDNDWTVSGTNQYSAVSGNVGIGTASPSRKLHVSIPGAGDIASFHAYNDANPCVTIGDDNSAPGEGFMSLEVASSGTEAVKLTASSGHPSFFNAGNVGIQTSTPAYNLEVNGTFQADNVRSGSFDLPTADGSSGQFLTYDGTWATPSASGDITSVTAGNDLVGGGTAGAVTLNIEPTLNYVSDMNFDSFISDQARLKVGSGSPLAGRAFSDFGTPGGEGIWLSVGSSSDEGGIFITESGVIVQGDGDQDLLRIYDDDAGATRYSFTSYNGFLPGTDNYLDLGNVTYSWQDIYLDGNVYIDGSAGTAGQVLTSNGTSGAYWTTPSSSVDTDWTIGSGVIYNSANEVAIGTTTSDGHGLNVEHYTSGTAAVRGTDGTSTIYAEGLLGVLSYSGLPLSVTNIGVLGIKSANGANGAAVYAWNNDDNGTNYAVYANANGSSGTNYGVYSSASGGTSNYAGYFDGDVRITGRLYDSSGDVGSSGQVLTSTGSGTNWATASGGVSGSGTSGRNARWTGTTTLGNSAMYDNGSQISVGAAVNTDYQIYGYDADSGDMAVYGRNAYSTDHYGYLGGSSYGVYGADDGGRYGYLGGSSYGVYGYYSSTSYGYLGSSSYGVYGRGTYGVYSTGTSYGFYTDGSMSSYGIYSRNSSSSTGDHSIYGYQSSSTAATSYAYSSSINGVVGYTFYGQAYHFGVYGLRDDDGHVRSGGVFGSCDNDANGDWGSLGYQNSGRTEYGGYFYGGYTGGSGFFARTIEDASANILTGMDDEPHINVGVGSWGDLFGADIHGKIYGTFTEGGRYSSYDHGDRYVDGLDIHLQKSDSEQNSILYTNVSTDVSVQASGFGRLDSGVGRVEFDDNFSNVISHEVPVVVTVTPIGNCKGVYIAELSNNGFSVSEVGDGESNVQFTWIALGRRAGFEDPQLPTEVTSSDYVEKIRDGLRPDGDLAAGEGSGLYFLNGELNTEVHPSCLPNEERLALKKQLSEKPESKTWEEWTEAFRAFGDTTPPITKEQYESHIMDKEQDELMEQEAQSHAQNVEQNNK